MTTLRSFAHTLFRHLPSSPTASGLGIVALLFAGAALPPVGYAQNTSQPQQFLPLPEGARPVSVPAEGYRVQKVGTNSYVVLAGFVQSTFVVTGEGVVLIDAPPALAKLLPVAIKSVTDKSVSHVILTHDHIDHIGAATDFAGAKLIAHRDTAGLFKIYPDPKRPTPDIIIQQDQETLDIGGVKFDFDYPGANHESGNMLVYLPQDKLVVMTDLVMPGWAPYRAWGNADYIPGILKAHDAILARDFDTYVGGHVYRTGTRQDVIDSRDYWNDMWTWTGEAMGTVPFDMSVAEPGNAWAVQKVWFDRVADKVTAQLIQKWGARLGGVDTFTHATVIALIVSKATDVPNIPPAAH